MPFQFPRFLPRLSLMTCVALALALPGAARAEDGVTADTIVFGQVAPLEGPEIGRAHV